MIPVWPFTVESSTGFVGRYKSLSYARTKAQRVANSSGISVRVYDNWDRLREVADPDNQEESA